MSMDNQTEIQEREPRGREIVLHFIRHGEAEYPTEELYHEGQLTPTGRDQARYAAHQLYNELEEGAMVAFNSSPRRRAMETASIIQEELISLEKEKSKHLTIRTQLPVSIKRININNKLTDEYLELEEKGLSPGRFWLENPGQTTTDIASSFGSLLRTLAHFAPTMRESGPNIHLIFVTHTGPSEVFVGRLINQTPVGTLVNCEEFRIHLPVSGQPPIVEFKDIRQEITA